MPLMLHGFQMPDCCELEHKVFSSLGEVSFRRSSTDGVAMMALRLGEREAMLPLESLRREFAIGKDSADGRMLDLIGSALDYVPSVQPGDRLPAEIRTGEASWRPGPVHNRLAATRLRLDLVAWMSPGSHWAEAGRDEATLLQLAEDPALREAVHAMADIVAKRLDLPDGGEVVRLMDEVAWELAYIEALRERLLARIVHLHRRLGRLLHNRKRPALAFDTLSQVHRLASVAAKQIADRFEDVDAQTGEIGSLLRNVANQRRFIRANRDGLYQTQRAWDPLLEQWCRTDEHTSTDLAPLLASTYHFLAQRFLPGTAWQRHRQSRRRGTPAHHMAW